MKRSTPFSLASWRRDESGSSALEFAIVCFPLILFMFGILEFGRAVWIEQALQNTATAVARCIGLQMASCTSGGAYSSSATATYATTIAQQWDLTISSSNINNVSTTATCGTSSASFAQVTLNYTFTQVTNLIPLLEGKTLTAQACFPMG